MPAAAAAAAAARCHPAEACSVSRQTACRRGCGLSLQLETDLLARYEAAAKHGPHRYWLGVVLEDPWGLQNDDGWPAALTMGVLATSLPSLRLEAAANGRTKEERARLLAEDF